MSKATEIEEGEDRRQDFRQICQKPKTVTSPGEWKEKNFEFWLDDLCSL